MDVWKVILAMLMFMVLSLEDMSIPAWDDEEDDEVSEWRVKSAAIESCEL